MVKCELCGRQFKTPQGLRGHKTFFHGLHAGNRNPTKLEENSFNKSDKKLERLTKDVEDIAKTLADLKGSLNYLQSRIVSMASRRETQSIIEKIDRLDNQVMKHDRWLNPRRLHEAIINLDGGPIVSIENCLRHRRAYNK
jgi:hypothetical protein